MYIILQQLHVSIYTYLDKAIGIKVVFTLRVLLTSDRLLNSLVVECWLLVLEVPGSIPSQGLRHTKDIIKMVPVVPLFSAEH